VEDPEYLLSAGGELGPNYYYNETNTQVKIGLKDSLNVKDLVDHINAFIVHSNFFNKVKYNETAMVSLINKNLELQKTDLDSMNKLNLNKFTSPGSNIIYANDISEIKRNIYSIDEKLIRNQRGIIRLDDPINLINYPILVQPSLIEAILMAAIKSLLLLIPLSIVLFVSRFWKKARAAFKQNPMA
jgi:hypothetical protein